MPCRTVCGRSELSWAYCFANMCATYSMLHVSIACNANGNCNGNGYGKCCHIASQYPFSPCVCVWECVWLLFLLHIFTMAFTFFSPVVVFVVVCVFMFYTSNCCLMCYSPPPTKPPHRGLLRLGERGMGVPARWSQVRIILQTFKNQFQHNTLDKYECKKLLPSSCSLSAFLFLLPPPRGFWINLWSSSSLTVTECRLPSSADTAFARLAPAAALALLFYVRQFIKT